MPSSQRPLVNQRLYFARLHGDWLREKLDEQQHPRSVVEQALGESLVLHLVMVYRAYLKEIAEAYQLQTEALSARELSRQMTQQAVNSAECEELCALEDAGQWVAHLLGYFQHIGSDNTGSRVSAGRSSDLGIPVQVIDSQAINAKELLHIQQQLQALIDKQRACLEEW